MPEMLVGNRLSEEEMFRAAYARDTSYDGLFFLAVTSTGIFCFPSCPARKPRRDHIRFFGSRREALAQGFRPCMRCQPELDRGRHTYEVRLVGGMRHWVDTHLETANIEALAAEMAISPQHLMRLFRRVTGITIGEYIRRRRVARASMMLRVTDRPILDVAADVGYESLSTFYTAFTRIAGMPPGQFRRNAAVVGGDRHGR